MRGARGVCVVPWGHAWCQGGVRGARGRAWWRGGACVGYDEIRSMSGRYASYWNAFLFLIDLFVTFFTILFIAVLFTRRIANESILRCLG